MALCKENLTENKMKLLKYIIRFLYCKMHNINKAEYTLLTGGGKLGENCEIYSSVVFGSEPYLIEIGNNVRIGANCVVTENVPANSTVVLPHCRIIKKKKKQNNKYSEWVLDRK